MHSLFISHKQKLYAMALRLTGSPSDAEDVLQDTFVRAFRFMDSYRGDSALSTWLCRIAINLSRDLYKQKNRFTDECELSAREETQDVLAQKRLQNALTKLSEGYREVLVMHDVMEMGHQEIAQVLEIQEGTSKSQLHKARAKVRELLENN